MNRVQLSMPLETWMHLVMDPWASVVELQLALRELGKAEPSGITSRPVGRPLQADHPFLDAKQLKEARDLLFTQERITNKKHWALDGVKPTRLAADQDGVEPDEVRLDNGQVAVLNLDLEGVPPQPKFSNDS